MVVQRTINNLKERPKDERKAVASFIAIGLIVILLIAWAIVFFRRIQSGVQNFQTSEATTSTTVQTTQDPQNTFDATQQNTQIQDQGSATVQLGSTTPQY